MEKLGCSGKISTTHCTGVAPGSGVGPAKRHL